MELLFKMELPFIIKVEGVVKLIIFYFTQFIILFIIGQGNITKDFHLSVAEARLAEML